jgi:hypothetical protein
VDAMQRCGGVRKMENGEPEAYIWWVGHITKLLSTKGHDESASLVWVGGPEGWKEGGGKHPNTPRTHGGKNRGGNTNMVGNRRRDAVQLRGEAVRYGVMLHGSQGR